MFVRSATLWIQSPQKKGEIFACVRQLVAQHTPLTQVFFYFEGVRLLADPVFSEIFQEVLTSTPIYACQHYVEKEKMALPSGVKERSLVDFFIQHWHDQSELFQF